MKGAQAWLHFLKVDRDNASCSICHAKMQSWPCDHIYLVTTRGQTQNISKNWKVYRMWKLTPEKFPEAVAANVGSLQPAPKKFNPSAEASLAPPTSTLGKYFTRWSYCWRKGSCSLLVSLYFASYFILFRFTGISQTISRCIPTPRVGYLFFWGEIKCSGFTETTTYCKKYHCVLIPNSKFGLDYNLTGTEPLVQLADGYLFGL